MRLLTHAALSRPVRPLNFLPTIMIVVLPVAACAAATTAFGASATVETSSAVALTPEQACIALQALNDPRRRAQFEDTLRAIAAAGALASPSGAPPSVPAVASSPLDVQTRALEANGLATQLSRHIARSTATFMQRVRYSISALLDFPSVRQWWTWRLSTQEGRHSLLVLLQLLVVSLLPSLLVEWLTRRALRRVRGALAVRCDQSAELASDAAPHGRSSGRSAACTSALHAAHHWSRLQALPCALIHSLLAMVPLLAFALCASALLSTFGDTEAPVAHAVGVIADAYVIVRVTLLACAFFSSPDVPRLRLLPLRDRWVLFAQRWIACIAIIAGGAGALASACAQLGMTEDAHLALIKLVALVAHSMAAIAVLQCRVPISRAIRDYFTKWSTLMYFGHWLADIWAGSTAFVIMALWLIWAMDVYQGYEMVLHLGGLSLGVLLVARIVAIVLFGALGRAFNNGLNDASASIGYQRAYRYYPLLCKLVSLVIGGATLFTLLSIWGVHLGTFFVDHPIGHRLGSALATIVVAALVAVLTWGTSKVGVERWLKQWTAAGDKVRVARLRTLLPILRTTLFTAILMIVGLTALSQLGVDIGPLLAGASIFGVTLGFGSQKLVQDFITGIFVQLTENAMQVGDWVTVAGVSGSVEHLSIRTVRLRGSDGSLYTVPFSSITTINNSSRGIGNAAIKAVIAAGADVQYAIQTLIDIGAELRRDDKFKDGILSDFSFWGVDQINGASVTLIGQITCRDTHRWPVQREFNRRILERFTEHGIELANPQRSFISDTRERDSQQGAQYAAPTCDVTLQPTHSATHHALSQARPGLGN
ncbi:mechanosensitive ion channel family protein [Mycetohabitans sp. B46]|uniref:mechanosensitive ion channel family protein n=1 Tax=Mycetohabitans sp. B46 TaxID=2772536 RepID=UPI00307DA2B7